MKVLDFGLAKYMPFADDGADTWSRAAASRRRRRARRHHRLHVARAGARRRSTRARTSSRSASCSTSCSPAASLSPASTPWRWSTPSSMSDPPPLPVALHRPAPRRASAHARAGCWPRIAASAADHARRSPASLRARAARRKSALRAGLRPPGRGRHRLRQHHRAPARTSGWAPASRRRSPRTCSRRRPGRHQPRAHRTRCCASWARARACHDAHLAARLGRELGARWVLRGGFQRFGDRVRVTALLTDVDTGRSAARSRSTAARDEIFALQDRIVAELSAGLRMTAPARGRGPRDETAGHRGLRGLRAGHDQPARREPRVRSIAPSSSSSARWPSTRATRRPT